MSKRNELHEQFNIKYSKEQEIYTKDPYWRLGKSIPKRKSGVYYCSFYYNGKFVRQFEDTFSIMDDIEKFIETEGYSHPVVVLERIHLGLIDPEFVSDEKIQKQLIAEKFVSEEFAKKHYAKVFKQRTIKERLRIPDQKKIVSVTIEEKTDDFDPSDKNFDPYEPVESLRRIKNSTSNVKQVTYYRVGSKWVDCNGEALDTRISCKSIWDMRKLSATGKATLEDAFLYTPGACLQVIGDIMQRVISKQIIDGLYKLSKALEETDISSLSASEQENIEYYMNLYKEVQDSAECMQWVLTSTDSTIIKALTLPYITGEPLLDESNIKVQTYQEFIFSLQMRLYNLMSSKPKLVSFKKVPFIKDKYEPVFDHELLTGTKAAPYMNLVYNIMTYQMSGYEAYLSFNHKWIGVVRREHARFMHDHMHQFIPFYREKTKVMAAMKSFNDKVVYMCTHINELCDMKLRDSKDRITAFNHEGIRYQLNCETLEMRGFMGVCKLTPEQLFELIQNYNDKAITDAELADRCKHDEDLIQLITDPKKQKELITKINRTYAWYRKQRSDKMKAKYGSNWNRTVWSEFNATELIDRRKALNKHLHISFGSKHNALLMKKAEETIEQFTLWWTTQMERDNHMDNLESGMAVC